MPPAAGDLQRRMVQRSSSTTATGCWRTGEWSARYKVTRGEQLGALGIVFTALNADAVMIIEAPDPRIAARTVGNWRPLPAPSGCATRKAIMGFTSETEQEIALLYDPDRVTVHHDPQGEPSGRSIERPKAPRFDRCCRYRPRRRRQAGTDPLFETAAGTCGHG